MTAVRTLARRPVTADDDAYVRDLVLEARPELGLLPDEVREDVLGLQVRAQRTHYAAQHTAVAEQVVLVDGRPAGRLVLAEDEGQVRVLDLVVAAAERRRGVASGLLRSVVEEAAGRRVRLAVRTDNMPARHLYESLGFRTVAAAGDHLEMELP